MRASLLLALALGGCGSSSVLVVDVLTDYTSDEVALVRTTVLADGHAPITSEESRPILTGSLAPVRVAGIERVPTGAHRIEVELLDAWSRRIDRGVVIARVTLTSQVIVRIERGCASRAMRCGDGEVCSRGRCEPERCTAEPRPLDCSPPCASDAECGASSGACGVARCVSGSCLTMFNGALCAPGERCRAPGECIADSARDGGTPDAGDACLEVDCDDRNSCTDDSCEAGVCVHAPNGAECDDGVYCNGGDRCAAGSCGSHAGDPCEGLSCDEGADRCLGCGPALPCPEPSCGPYGECDYASACATNGSRARTCTTFTCTSGTCVPSTRTETDTAGCARSTTGMSCSPTTCTAFGACGGFASTCDPTGAQSRTCTDYTCAAGMCAGTRRSDSQSCMRPTDGLSCGASTCGPWGACDYASTCDETATQTRSCNGAICASGSCISGMPNIESQDCIRDTDGAACGTGLACAGGSCGACPSGYGDCDGRTTNGCETSLVFPNCYGCDTCGANADRCGSGPDHRCSCGTRGYGCTQAGQICCGGSCRPPTDPDNCGACGRRCGDNQACSSGACVCASGWEDCNGDPGDGCETDLSGTNDCGACGATCADGETCTGGRCECFGNLGAPGGGAACLANRICCDALMRCAYPGVCE